MQSSGKRIEISVAEQKLRLLDEGGVIAEYPVSTSRFGIGCEEGSHCTPTGEFTIGMKIGHDSELRTIFKSRRPEGTWREGDQTDKDLVLTRILWLDGIEAGNANTRDRYIYIHGTNQEDLIGTPASEGCIRMRNADVAELFERVDEQTPVSIA
jgi:lipoprotein-anchoring transpeptidase ErfK/SrfK